MVRQNPPSARTGGGVHTTIQFQSTTTVLGAGAWVAGCVCSVTPCTTGSCSTVARCPSESCVTSTLLPSGNSIASWWRCGTSGSITPNFPTRKLVALFQIHLLSYSTSSANASSVPGSMQTATAGSLSDAKPRVEVPRNVVVISVSPTSAGRVSTAWRL